jgi:EAL and modified HD-GYP domain-containing signal transduction protein
VSETPNFWLGRQPILDRISTTVGYELLFRSGEANRAAIADGRMATARVISHAFGELGLATVLGDCRGYVNFDADLLMSETIEVLPRDQTVIEILETVDITPRLIDRCRELREIGFSFALDDVVRLEGARALLLPLIDVVKVDVSDMTSDELRTLVGRLRVARHTKLLAEKIDTREQAQRCHELGFDLFQGYFFARPTIIKGKRADPSKQQLLQLLEQTLDEDSDNAAIARTFKQAPELSYKLMRLVNSAGIGARAPIQSLQHALSILGRRQLQRWVQVLLFAQHGTGDVRNPLLQMAAARGKLMELLAEQNASDRTWPERAFMTGILSLLDALLELPMNDVLAELPLSQDVRAALVEREGRLGHMLRVIEALERADDANVAELLAHGDPCSIARLPHLQIAALAWSSALGRQQD